MTERSAYPRGMADLTITGEISKVDEDKRQVFGWASVTEIDGEPVVDLQNDLLDTYELEKAAYDYVLHSRVGGAMHERMKKSAPKQVGTLIESFVVTPEKVEKMGLPPETPQGWWIGFQLGEDDDVWKKVKKGEFTGFSIHGVGKRTPVEKSVMARTRQEYDGWLKRMAHITGEDADDLDLNLKSWMSQEGVNNPSDDDVHNFLMEAYSDGDSDGEVTKSIAKHLIGHHDQKSHGRREHKELREEKKEAYSEASSLSMDIEDQAFQNVRESGKFSMDEMAREGQKILDAITREQRRLEKDPEYQGTVSRLLEAQERQNPRKKKSRKKREKRWGLSKSDQRKLFLLAKIAERSKSEDEAASYAETVSKALDEAGQEELSTYFSAVHKHLIGRHEQDDHDPTKSGKKRHKRTSHGGRWGHKGVKRGMAAGAGLGALSGLRFGLGGAAAGAIFGGGTGYQVGGGQFYGNVDPNAGAFRRGGAGLLNLSASIPGTIGRRLIHGNPNKRRKKMSKAFSEREREVLSKYLGKDFM